MEAWYGVWRGRRDKDIEDEEYKRSTHLRSQVPLLVSFERIFAVKLPPTPHPCAYVLLFRPWLWLAPFPRCYLLQQSEVSVRREVAISLVHPAKPLPAAEALVLRCLEGCLIRAPVISLSRVRRLRLG